MYIIDFSLQKLLSSEVLNLRSYFCFIDEEEYEPPKVESTEVAEEGSLYSVK